MPNVHRNALVPYRPEDMFVLVADVRGYPDFLPWCRSAQVEPVDENAVKATIEIVRGRVRKSFTTRNVLEPDRAIAMHLLDGPFKFLEGRWRFEPLGDAGCKVSLDMEFEFSSKMMKAVVGPVFNEITNSLVDAFCRRAAQVYGA